MIRYKLIRKRLPVALGKRKAHSLSSCSVIEGGDIEFNGAGCWHWILLGPIQSISIRRGRFDIAQSGGPTTPGGGEPNSRPRPQLSDRFDPQKNFRQIFLNFRCCSEVELLPCGDNGVFFINIGSL